MLAINNSIETNPYKRPISVNAGVYGSVVLDISVLDDEAAVFRNPLNWFDVNGANDVTPLDALLIINDIRRRGGTAQLDPFSETPDPTRRVDVSGDYLVSPLDVIQVVNELRRQSGNAEGEYQLESIMDVSTSGNTLVDQGLAKYLLDSDFEKNSREVHLYDRTDSKLF